MLVTPSAVPGGRASTSMLRTQDQRISSDLARSASTVADKVRILFCVSCGVVSPPSRF